MIDAHLMHIRAPKCLCEEYLILFTVISVLGSSTMLRVLQKFDVKKLYEQYGTQSPNLGSLMSFTHMCWAFQKFFVCAFVPIRD